MDCNAKHGEENYDAHAIDNNLAESQPSPVEKKPPSFGSFTKFTIDEILHCSRDARNKDNSNVQFCLENDKLIPGGQQQSGLCISHRNATTPRETVTEKLDARTEINNGENEETDCSSPERPADSQYSWLHCTRYKPPKLPSRFCSFFTFISSVTEKRKRVHLTPFHFEGSDPFRFSIFSFPFFGISSSTHSVISPFSEFGVASSKKAKKLLPKNLAFFSLTRFFSNFLNRKAITFFDGKRCKEQDIWSFLARDESGKNFTFFFSALHTQDQREETEPKGASLAGIRGCPSRSTKWRAWSTSSCRCDT